ncbi:MAG TPA: VCBS repeat-containing protein, partial [bacterium]
MLRKNATCFCVLALLAGLPAYALDQGPDVYNYYYSNFYFFGNALCLERIDNDAYLDVLGGANYEDGWGNMTGNSRYMFNDTPSGNLCRFDVSTGVNLEYIPAHQANSGYIRGTNYPRDIVLSSSDPDAIRIYSNTLNGILTNPQVLTDYFRQWNDLGFIDNNLYEDLVASGGNSVYYFRNTNGAIPSTPYQTINVSGGAGQVQLHNMNAQWSPTPQYEELIVANGQYLKIYLNLGNGSLATSPAYSLNFGSAVGDFAVTDLNRDGYRDVVACDLDYIKVWFNDDGEFSSSPDQSFSYGYEMFQQIALGEYNYDGCPDLAVGGVEYAYIFQNNADGSGFNTTPVWTSHALNQWYGLGCGFNELVFADLQNYGGYSLVGAAVGGEPGTPVSSIIVFREIRDPRVCPIKYFSVMDNEPGHHPLLTWDPNTEADMARYNVYRALMEDETPPVHEDFELLAVVQHPDTSYLDSTVTVHTGYDNYKIWYAVTAEDDSSNESLMSEFIRFWGYYEEESIGEAQSLISAVQPDNAEDMAMPNPFNPATSISFELRDASFVRLDVYDTSGRLVAELANGWCDAGSHEV